MLERSGFLLIDKPGGCSSFDVIRRLRQLTGIRKIGHTGTVDPFATGLLICATKSATRLCRYLESEDKTYSATLRLGVQTATGDPEGDILNQSGPVPAKVDAVGLRSRLLELKELLPPRHSALKVRGRPAYDYARRGEAIDLAPRPVTIHEFTVTSYEPPDLRYVCRVSKGTYVRSLSEYIASCLGTVGHTLKLRREAIGDINVDEACRLDALDPADLSYYPIRQLFRGREFIAPSAAELIALRNGLSIGNEGPDATSVLLVDQLDNVLGVARREAGRLIPMINLAGVDG